MKLGLVIGRFQPLHKGHIRLISQALIDCDKVLILIGSSNKVEDFKNPFTLDERVKLLDSVFGNEPDVLVRSLKDTDTDDEWVQNVIGHAISLQEDPTQVTLYCNPKDEDWYRENFIYPLVTVDSLAISATQIRHAWYTSSTWTVQEFIPEETMDLMLSVEDERFVSLSEDYTKTTAMNNRKTNGHPFGNPVEVVTFAVIMRDWKVLVGLRGGTRGHGTWGLPGGFLEASETTMEGALRETKEELGLDLKQMITQGKALCLTTAVSENLGDLSTRTVGVNYLFVVSPDAPLDLNVDNTETTEYLWVDYKDICSDAFRLFFNHNQIVRQLLSKVGNSK
jgi:bifunctional NMN adenylyltransferase/nudix hydrolase